METITSCQSMTETYPIREASMEAEEGFRRSQDMDREGNNKLDLPEDGYQWKKYGQKFIKHVNKYRSYFKCHNAECRAKKRADWSYSEPGNLRVVYNGVHTHAPLTHSHSSQQGTTSTSTSGPNPYNLLTQVLGDQTASFRHDN
ncbi:hypothetical protein F0562_001278 [Nyssa sinensis]|uniref:WRKY domain-containing protein n=1 Tax=Nyssa sinensis TaxID=561372 RepID=A0A5J5C4E9_9ASTE|nr:hypothetical protein F0562_001278 [Nyssa sinensis]